MTIAQIARRIFVCLCLGATAVYVLWQFHTGWGLLGGLLCLFLMLGTGFATDVQPGINVLKANAADLAPTVRTLFRGGPPS